MKTYFQLRSNLLSLGFLVQDIVGDVPTLSAEGNGKRVTYWENRKGDSSFLVYCGDSVEGYCTEDGDEMWSIKDMLLEIRNEGTKYSNPSWVKYAHWKGGSEVD